jgi:hypothetical protein
MAWHDSWAQMKKKQSQPQAQTRRSSKAKRTGSGRPEPTTAVEARQPKSPPGE